MQLTDREQKKLNEELFADGPITEKVKAIAESEAVRQAERVLKELLPFAQKVELHEEKIKNHEGFITRLRRGLGAAVKG